MQDVSDRLKRVNDKQRLHVLRGSPEKVLPVVWKDWGITHMVFEKVRRRVREGESMLKIVVGHRCLWYFLGRETRNSAHVFSAARQRDEHVVNTLVKQHAPHIKVIMKDGHNLLDPERVIKEGNNGKCITTLVAWKKVSSLGWHVRKG